MNATMRQFAVPIPSAITLLATTLALAILDIKEMHTTPQGAQISMNAQLELLAPPSPRAATHLEALCALAKPVSVVPVSFVTILMSAPRPLALPTKHASTLLATSLARIGYQPPALWFLPDIRRRVEVAPH